LLVSSELTKQINQIFRQAEEAAAKCITFDSGSIGGMLADAGLAAGHGLAGVSIGAALVDDTSKPDLRKTIFNDDYMNRLVGLKMQGMDVPELNKAMETIINDKASEADVQAALVKIAKLRDVPLEKIQADHKRFVELRKRATEKGDVDQLDQDRHPDFLGSTTSLRFGKVLGDVFGIDPVFGSLLSPTGGLVGYGNIAIDAKERPVGYHGIMHDAGGYLLKHHEMGPGYDYLGLEGRNPTHPLTGQESGIRYWNQKLAYGFIDGDGINLNNPVQKLAEYAVIDAVDHRLGQIVDVHEGLKTVKNAANDGWNAAKDAANDGWHATKDAASDRWNAASKSAKDIFSFLF